MTEEIGSLFDLLKVVMVAQELSLEGTVVLVCLLPHMCSVGNTGIQNKSQQSQLRK